MDTKICAKCKNEVSIDQFVKNVRMASGYNSYCSPCRKDKYSVKKYNDNRAKARRDYYIKNKYGISCDEYDILLKKQRGCCAVCNKPETDTHKGKVKLLAVDHCHTTGQVRGLLCRKCNVSIGSMNDDINILEAAIKYLKNSYK